MRDSESLDAFLEVDEYLAMVRSLVANETRFEIVHAVWEQDTATIEDLTDQTEFKKTVIEDHVDAAVDTGLIARRERTERGTKEATVYYTSTVHTDIILEDGILELFEV